MTKGSRYVRIGDIDVLSRPNCKIKEPERVERLVNEIINGGPSQLQIVTDFDYTLTKQKTEDGKPMLSSFGLFDKCKSLPPSFLAESKKLYDKYRPIEICPRISQEEKKEHMIEWWRLSAALLKGFPFDPKELDELASHYSHALRDGAQDMFNFTNKLNVPVLVFSAGLGDSILAVLRHEQVLFPNVKLVSNFLQYKDGVLNGFNFSDKTPMIHTFNKNETVLSGSDYYKMVQQRQNIILMGDSLGDSNMAEGMPSSSCVLKIGFLFDHPEINLPKYQERFDIVLIDDQTMDVPRKLISLIAAYHA